GRSAVITYGKVADRRGAATDVPFGETAVTLHRALAPALHGDARRIRRTVTRSCTVFLTVAVWMVLPGAAVRLGAALIVRGAVGADGSVLRIGPITAAGQETQQQPSHGSRAHRHSAVPAEWRRLRKDASFG